MNAITESLDYQYELIQEWENIDIENEYCA